jgi:hypothetical protein
MTRVYNPVNTMVMRSACVKDEGRSCGVAVEDVVKHERLLWGYAVTRRRFFPVGENPTGL